MTGLRPAMARRTTTVLVLLLFAILPSLELPLSPAGADSQPLKRTLGNPSLEAPLSGSIGTESTSWATVLMGRNDGHFDLFWQLFVWTPSTGRWSLTTPPGVADNGGLMVAPAANGTTGIVGFGASQNLTFSPLALTTDGAKSWHVGGLPTALVRAPTVLSIGGTTSALALVGDKDPEVLSQAGGPTSWKRIVTEDELRTTPAGRRCVLAGLESVSYDPAGNPVIGAACRAPGTPGVLVRKGTTWELAAIPVPASLANAAFGTVRLDAGSALLTATPKSGTNIVAAWDVFGKWSTSPPLRLPNSSDLLASGQGPGATQFVVVGKPDGPRRAEVVTGPGAAWHALPPLPAGTATIALETSGAVVALSVEVTKCTVWALGPRDAWEPVQTLRVPIAFGSSS